MQFDFAQKIKDMSKFIGESHPNWIGCDGYNRVTKGKNVNRWVSLMQTQLPSFANPPVVETVLGVQFEKLKGWTIPHYGLFWNQIRTEFPRTEVKPPLPSEIETFDKPKPQAVNVELFAEPEVRCWFCSEDESNLIQVQQDRFVFNWRKAPTEKSYPRYDSFVRPAFEKNWDAFSKFVDSEKIEFGDIRQCEVTYVNHISVGDGWKTANDWKNVFSILNEKLDSTFLPERESLGFNINYRLPEEKGRLRIIAKSAIRQFDGEDIISLTLTARGKPNSSQANDIVEWLNLGREWIVRGFADITTNDMHKIWGREL